MTPLALFDSSGESAHAGGGLYALEELASALVHLDHVAVVSCTAQLELLAARLEPGFQSGDPPHMAQVSSALRWCMDLCHNAAHFYAGWARVAAVQGTAYTASGDEPVLNSVTSLALKG